MTLFSRIALLSLFSPVLLAQAPSQSAPPAVAVQTVLTRAAAPDRALAIALMRDLATNGAQYRSDMRPMYHRMEYRGLWVRPAEQKISPAGVQALAALAGARQWGLLNSYNSGLRNVSDKRQYSATQLAQLELKITNAVLRLLADLANGQLDQSNPELRWGIKPVRVSFRQLMTELAKGTPVPQIAEKLSEQRFGQAKLLAELAKYDDIVAKGGWPLVLSEQILKPGMVDAAVTTLRRRLVAENYNSGPLRPGQSASLYDKELASVVRRFQANHGLKPDGEIGPTTQLALNLPAQLRRDQILANLERLRWLPQELGASRVWVNIPAFRLQLVDNNKTKLDMGVIVGRKERQTPVFDDLISQVEVNPTWNVPTTIAYEDYLPALRKNPLYLKKKNIRVFESWKKGAKELDPEKVKWQDVSTKSRRWFPYRLTQDAGGNNALGRVKFLFPNRHSVYLHDTPERHLFSRDVRALSSGCVRVEEPEALADYLLGELLGSPANYRQLLASKKTRRLFLDGSLPVYLTYFTTWVDEFGQLQFRDDIYGHDRPLLQMMGDISARNPQKRTVPPVAPRRAPAKPATILTANRSSTAKGTVGEAAADEAATNAAKNIAANKMPTNKKAVIANLKLKPAAKLRAVSAKPPIAVKPIDAGAKKVAVAVSQTAAQRPMATPTPTPVFKPRPKLVSKDAKPVTQKGKAALRAGDKPVAAKGRNTVLKVSSGKLGSSPLKTAKDVNVVPIIGTNKVVLTNVVKRPASPEVTRVRPAIVPVANTSTPIMVKTRSKPVLARGEAVVIPVRQAIQLKPKPAPAKPFPTAKPDTISRSVKVKPEKTLAKPAPAKKPTEKNPAKVAVKLAKESPAKLPVRLPVELPAKLPAKPPLKLKQSQVVEAALQSLPALAKPKPAMRKLADAPRLVEPTETISSLEDDDDSERNNRRYRRPRAR